MISHVEITYIAVKVTHFQTFSLVILYPFNFIEQKRSMVMQATLCRTKENDRDRISWKTRNVMLHRNNGVKSYEIMRMQLVKPVEKNFYCEHRLQTFIDYEKKLDSWL